MAEKVAPVVNGIFYDRAKLMIMVHLIHTTEALSFLELLQATQLTKGNLSSHLKKLEAEKLLKIKKEFVEKKPRTSIEITSKGRNALKEHLDEMQSLIKLAKNQ